MDEAVGKIKAAVAARDAIDPSFVICARVDSIGAEGMTFSDTIARCKTYASEGRADLVWINAVETRAQLKEVCAQTPAPVLCNWWSDIEARPTLEEFRQLGARVALYPTFVAQTGLQAAWHVLNDFRRRGDAALADWGKWVKASPYGPADYKNLTGHAQVRELEEKFLPPSKQRDYGGKKQ
jgi:2,3-dimethylmalate lyase